MFRVVLSVILVACAGPAAAQERVPLGALVAEALAANPAIRAAAHRQNAAQQRPAQARSLPDPMVSAGYTSVGSPLPGAGLGMEPVANIGFMVSQVIPYAGKRARLAAAAEKDAAAEGPAVEEARRAVVAQVKERYYALASNYAAADVLDRNTALLDTLVRVSEGRYAVGQAAQQDVIKAQSELSLLELRRRRLFQDRAVIVAALNTLRGRPPATPLGQPDAMELVAFDHALPDLLDLAREQSPMLQRERLLIDKADADIAIVRDESRPDFTVSGGYASMGALGHMFEARVDLNIPLRKTRRLAALAERTAEASSARAEYEASLQMLDAQVQEHFSVGETSRDLARLYRDTVLPQARLALESALTSYQSGRVDFTAVLMNFGAVLEHEMHYVEELASFHIAASRLEEMTGTTLVH